MNWLKWKPSKHVSARWRVTVPAKFSDTGSRRDQYFDTKKAAEDFIEGILKERTEHGKAAVSAEERHWIQVAKTELGSLDKLRDVLDHWKRTGKGVKEITAIDASELFITDRSTAGLNPKTFDDIKWRLRRFGKDFGSSPLHQITPGEIEIFLKGFTAGWSRRSFYKRLLPFFAYAKRHRWLAEDPFDELVAPDTPRSGRNVYTPDEFNRLINAAEFQDDEVLAFIGFAGMAFCRTRELVRQLKDEPVLEWRDVLMDRNEIHIREEVGKHTKRSSNERFIPIHPMLRDLLASVGPYNGRVVKVSMRLFRERLHTVFRRAEVPFIDNGLRKSAISYWLAAHPEFGVAQVSQWAGNSEPSCRQHYLRILTKEDGEKWFGAVWNSEEIRNLGRIVPKVTS